jgi:hypothetical protein
MRANEIESTLSSHRLQRFLTETGGNAQALRLYRWNAQVASAYWTPLHFMEVAVRNAIHDALTESKGTAWWFRDDVDERAGASWFYDFEREAVGKAMEKLYAPLTPGKVVAELHFGFWVGLVSGRYVSLNGGADYHDVVWVKGGVAARFGGAKRGVIYKRLDRLRRFRNRIAHHEHLMGENLDVISTDIDSILRRLCPATATWVRAMSDVSDVRARRPPGQTDPLPLHV